MKFNNLQKARETLGKSKTEVAKEVGIARLSYFRYETGERMPDVQTAIRISRALNSTVEDLWDGNPTKQAAFLL